MECPEVVVRIGFLRNVPGPDGLDGKNGIYLQGESPDGLRGTDGSDGPTGPPTIYPYIVNNGPDAVGFQGTPPLPAPPGVNGTNGVDGRDTQGDPNNFEVYSRTGTVAATTVAPITTLLVTLAGNLASMRNVNYIVDIVFQDSDVEITGTGYSAFADSGISFVVSKADLPNITLINPNAINRTYRINIYPLA